MEAEYYPGFYCSQKLVSNLCSMIWNFSLKKIESKLKQQLVFRNLPEYQKTSKPQTCYFFCLLSRRGSHWSQWHLILDIWFFLLPASECKVFILLPHHLHAGPRVWRLILSQQTSKWYAVLPAAGVCVYVCGCFYLWFVKEKRTRNVSFMSRTQVGF